MSAPLQRAHLRFLVHAPKDDVPDIQLIGVGREALTNLSRELARRRQDERTNLPPR